MNALRSKTVTILAATMVVGLIPFGLTALGGLPAAAPPEAATIQPAADIQTPTYSPAWIAIQTGATSKITLNTANGQQGPAQTLDKANQCGVDQGAASSRFLTLKGSTGGAFTESLASYASGSIGVKEKKSGTSCSQVGSPSETLELSLGARLKAAYPQAMASSAYLDVELKQSARIEASAYLGTTLVGTFELQSGTTIGQPPLTAGAQPFVCTGSADSGPDSGANDNCRWPISEPTWLGADDGVNFDRLSLRAVNGSFSLEGGGDGTVLPTSPKPGTENASIIEVITDTITCGGETRLEEADGDAPAVRVYRLQNAGTETCVAVPYVLAHGSGFAQFLKPLNTQTSAQFIWDLTWKDAPTPGSSALPEVTIDYETGASAQVQLGWCPNATYTGGVFNGYTAAQVATLPDQDEYPGTQYACLISRTARSVDADPDHVSVNEKVYVYGDARLSH